MESENHRYSPSTTNLIKLLPLGPTAPFSLTFPLADLSLPTTKPVITEEEEEEEETK